MEIYFEKQVKNLCERANEVIDSFEMSKANKTGNKLAVSISSDFKNDFFSLVDKVSLSLLEDKENFYGYFLLQMLREIRFDISTPTAVNFKSARYVIYFNPIIFLNLNMKQMETTIKHEILHIVSMHLIRAKELKGRYSNLAINMAMDIVVNKYLNNLPPYATTLEWVNLKYSLELKPFESFEYYADNIQTHLDLLEESDEGELDDSRENDSIKSEYDIERTHDIWEDSDEIDEKTIREFTQRFIENSSKNENPAYLAAMIKGLKKNKAEVPWNLYLNRMMGTIESNKKKTITRRDRRQPHRLDLRGGLRNHKANIAVALDISGSISEEEFKQAIKEVLNIVKIYNNEIEIVECDNEVRRTYKAKSLNDVKDRISSKGATKFSPVFSWANRKNVNLLIYFTDGDGENKLQIVPKGYKVLWVISGRGQKLSLENPYGMVKKLSKVDVKDKLFDMSDVRSDGYSMNNQAPIL